MASPFAAILMPVGFFLSVLTPEATAPNALIGLVFVGGLFLVGGVLSVGVGLLRGAPAGVTMSPRRGAGTQCVGTDGPTRLPSR